MPVQRTRLQSKPPPPIVKILPPEQWLVPGPVQYSLDGGLTLTHFQPGGIHQVPEYAARNMELRGWAKVINPAEIETQDTTETTIAMSELRKKE